MFKVYSIVVTYNGMQWIDKCLNSLQASSVPNHIIVIDNLSTDGTPDYIEQNFPNVELIRSEENLGFGKGNNIGLRKALNDEADYVFLLNQDAWVETDTLEKLTDVQQNNPAYGILSPAHLNGKGDGLETKFAEYAGPDNTPGLLSDMFIGKLKQVYTSQFVNAAAWLISRECLTYVGGFDPIFPHYCEDIDYINRCKFHDKKIGIVPTCTIVHDTKEYSWGDIKYNKQLRLNFHFLELKNINSSFRSCIAKFLKKQLDTSTTNILFRKPKDLSFNCSLTIRVLLNLRKIKTSRNITIQKQAFL
ncbi:MAG: glycosyltransferase family 2 protein [Marinilabiliaceae bacterium]|nr:glycosyltransferase family 2 protein [Marinilabiliaceae bacterium]